MISTNEGYTRLEYFSEDVAADKNRKELIDKKSYIVLYKSETGLLVYWRLYHRILGIKCIL